MPKPDPGLPIHPRTSDPRVEPDGSMRSEWIRHAQSETHSTDRMVNLYRRVLMYRRAALSAVHYGNFNQQTTLQQLAQVAAFDKALGAIADTATGSSR